MQACVVAIDIGGTNLRAARVDRMGNIACQQNAPAPGQGGAAVLDAVLELVSRIPLAGVRAVGVDVPGLAYPDGRVWAPNLKGWKRMPVKKRLEEALKLPVVVESDRNAFVMGECWKGAGRGARDVVYVAVGTGIGAGILMDGRLVRGYCELAGCVGWMAVRDRFTSAYEEVGCLESLAAGRAIGRVGSRRLKRSMSGAEVARLARQGDGEAESVLRDCGFYLGLGLANLVSTLNPEVIALGGGVVQSKSVIFTSARETMRRWAQPIAVRKTRLVVSKLGGSASLLGVARIAFEHEGTPC
jgi:glucokinase